MAEKPYYYDWDRFETGKGKEPDPEPSRPPRKKSGGVLEFLVILIVAFALVFGFVRPFVVEAFYIPSGSMIPTLEVGDRVLTNKFIYRFEDPERGDVVVFQSVEGGDEDLIKRVVGVPGDTLRVVDGQVIRNGKRLEEDYAEPCGGGETCTFRGSIKVPADHYFMMGDNRGASDDSRFWGPVPRDWVIGGAFATYWPPKKIGLL